jgi:cobalt-zinc-cadmium efflux system protein
MLHHHAHSEAGHEHGHGHSHAPANFDRAFVIGIALNAGFVVAEVVWGIAAGSLALLADAGHNLADVLGLTLAWTSVWLARRPATATFTYGLRRSSIMAALANAVLVLVATGMIAWEAFERLSAPQSVAAPIVIAVASAGIVINGVTAWLFACGRQGDINIRGAFVHMLADAAIAAGVVITAIITLWTGWMWIDPVAGLAIAGLIIWGTWGLLSESLRLSLDAVPSTIDQAKVGDFLAGLPGVTEIGDLHIWSMSTTEVALTAHLIRPGAIIDDVLTASIAHELDHQFGIAHATIQFQTTALRYGCRDQPRMVKPGARQHNALSPA